MMDHNVRSPDVPIPKWSQQNCLVPNKTLNRWKLYLLCIARFPIGRGNAKAMSDAFPYFLPHHFIDEKSTGYETRTLKKRFITSTDVVLTLHHRDGQRSGKPYQREVLWLDLKQRVRRIADYQHPPPVSWSNKGYARRC